MYWAWLALLNAATVDLAFLICASLLTGQIGYPGPVFLVMLMFVLLSVPALLVVAVACSALENYGWARPLARTALSVCYVAALDLIFLATGPSYLEAAKLPVVMATIVVAILYSRLFRTGSPLRQSEKPDG